MVSPRFCFGLGSRLAALLLATAAALLAGCGGGSGGGAPTASPAVSSTPRSAGGFTLTLTADHRVYARNQPVMLTYSAHDDASTSQLFTAVGGFFAGDAVREAQTLNLFPAGNTAPASTYILIPLVPGETIAYQRQTEAVLPPGTWNVVCFLDGRLTGASDPAQPPFATNPIRITVLP